MTGNPGQKKIAFGTDGIRGNAEQFPFTDDAVYALGKSIAQWAHERYGKKPKILVGGDTRISTPRIQKILCQALVDSDVTVFNADVLPTPAVCHIIFYDKSFDAGIVISASHNPFYDNGIKIFDGLRCKLTTEDEKTITKYFETWIDGIGQVADLVHAKAIELPEAREFYCRRIASSFPVDFLRGLKIVIDCANGATSFVAPDIFVQLGATIYNIAAEPNGTNINANCGSLHPEVLAQAVVALNAHCGFAFDGDGDRIIAVNKHGQIKDGDDILALLLSLPAYNQARALVGTIVSNQGLEVYCQNELGKNFIRANVGDKHVAAELEKNNLVLGGEPSGHIILNDYMKTGDGIFVALKVLEAMICNDNWDMHTFTKYPQVSINVPVAQKKDLKEQPFAAILEKYEQELENKGRLIVRYSGTESVLRVVVEAVDSARANTIAQQLADQLKAALE